MTRYDILNTYDWNYEHDPRAWPELDVPAIAGTWNFCGIPVQSPLGVPAGPLLNSGWLLYYSRLGFDVLTYKTVRSRYRKCYDLPNLLPVSAPQLTSGDSEVLVAPTEPPRSWAISFGMPSKEPAVWRADVEHSRRGLLPGQVLVVSVVASPEPNWTLANIVADFTQLAAWAKDSGAHAVEANLSCPNVCSQEGQLYTSPRDSAEIAAAMHASLDGTPLVLKIGLFAGMPQAAEFIEAVRPYCAALSTVNSVSAVVRDESRSPYFDGAPRGIGGECVRDRCQSESAMLASVLRTSAPQVRLIGVGGVSNADDVRQRLSAGAHHVQIATAAMLNPLLGIKIRRELEPA